MAQNKPTVIINIAGNTIDLGIGNEKANAVIQAFYPEALGSQAVAELLLGKFTPSSRLPVTFYHNNDPMPEFTDYSMEGRTYKYFQGAPLYPLASGFPTPPLNTMILCWNLLILGKRYRAG